VYELWWWISFNFPSFSPKAWTEQDIFYLFIRDYRLGEDGTCRAPYAYWSKSPDGNVPLSDFEATLWGLPKPEISMNIGAINHDASNDSSIDLLYKACGFDPTRDDLARSLNFPLIQTDLTKGESYILVLHHGSQH